MAASASGRKEFINWSIQQIDKYVFSTIFF